MSDVNAKPTKEFFITMLTRDIPLANAIIDLVDNSVDAAHKLKDLPKKWIHLTLNKDQFIIKDNCGGIKKSDAESYAFRFGRSKNSPPTGHSVGQFGVGMKRTLFKLGKNFSVSSKHSESSFDISVDVDSWLNETEDDWKFTLNEFQNSGTEFGTTITVNNLLETVSANFSDVVFINNLIKEISCAHFKSLHDGIEIKVNDTIVRGKNIEIKCSDELKPAVVVKDIGEVSVKIIVGIGERDKEEGGWYIICNGRLVAEHEQTSITGWGIDGVRKYHPDFALFRGIVYLDCDQSDKLPWTTTKKGIDVDSPVYRSVLSDMRAEMRTVMEFLSQRVKEETDKESAIIEETPLNDALGAARLIGIFDIPSINQSFLRPDAAKRTNVSPVIKISYHVPKDKFNLVKESLGSSSTAQVGEETFNYYYRYECGDE